MAAYGAGAVVGLERQPRRIVDDARDDLAHVDRALHVQRHDAVEFRRVEPRSTSRLCRLGLHPGPVQAGDDIARRGNGVFVVFCKVFSQAGDGGVQVGAAQFLVGGDFAGGGLQQRRAGQERAGAVAHHHHVVGQAGHVGAACRGRAVHDRDHRQPGRGQPRQVVEDRAAAHELVHAVLAQVGAG
ncbi:hypothetical protein D9M72_437430 [compost metagenome]